ncbi:MAG TPA: hypothetical protein VK563_05475, partial [Puia sp.]|nr:hypothetical protein [Puia sp.]
KLRNGSLRDYTPDHYPLGFMMVAYGREKYGDEFWRKVTLDAAAFKGPFYPLQTAVEKYAGIPFRQFRRDALDYFRNKTPAGADEYARAHKHFAGSEEFPQLTGGDSLLFISSSYRRIPAFVIKDGQEQKETSIRTRAISLDNYFSFRNGRLVYAAYETDPRWSWRDYSVLRVLDLSTGKERRITSRSRYFSPDISADGLHVVAVQEAVDGSCELHILDSRNGSVEKRIPNKEGLFYTYPKFYNERQIVSAVRNTKGQMALALLNASDGSADFLTPFSYNVIGFPSVSHDTIWFTASRNGRDEAFAAAGGHIFRVHVPQTSAQAPSIQAASVQDSSGTGALHSPAALFPPGAGVYEFQSAAGKYTWTSFSSVGYRMSVYDAGNTRLELIPDAMWAELPATQGLGSLEKGPAHLLDTIAAGSFPVNKYPVSFRLLNFHSWRPYINDPDYQFSIVSENILNTLQSEVYVDYNRNEKYKQVGIDATYGALYPWIDAGLDYVFGRNSLTRIGKAYWNEVNAYAGASIPLNFTRGRSHTGLQFGSDAVYERRYFTGALKDSFDNRAFTYLRNYLSFTHQIQQTQQQIFPRFAQSLYLGYNRSVSGPLGEQFLASGYLYLPGLALTNSLVLGAAWQQRDALNQGGFSNGFPFSRGYSAENYYKMWRLTANYHLPLAYPDWGIGNIVYFLRIRTALFYDHMHAQDFGRRGNLLDVPFRSYGTEIYFDTKWWNQLPISFGIRYSHLMDPDSEGRGPNQWEFILPVNLLGK